MELPRDAATRRGGPSTSWIAFLGGELRILPHLKVVTEHYVGGNRAELSDRVAMAGVRIFGRRVAGDLGVVIPYWPTGPGTPVPIGTLSFRF